MAVREFTDGTGRDGGQTLLPEARVDGTAACEMVDNRQARLDYFGMVTDDRGRFRLLWSDARGGLFRCARRRSRWTGTPRDPRGRTAP